MIPQTTERHDMGRRTPKSNRERRLERRARGRPIVKGDRTPSGQLSRAKQLEDAVEVVSIYRQRQYGLTPDQAKFPEAETVIGRLWLRSRITEPMRKAGERFLEIHDAAMRAIKAPMGLAKSSAPGTGGDIVTEEYITWAVKAVAVYEVAKGWCGEDLGLIEGIVIEQRQCSLLDLPRLCLRLAHLSTRMGIDVEPKT